MDLTRKQFDEERLSTLWGTYHTDREKFFLLMYELNETGPYAAFRLGTMLATFLTPPALAELIDAFWAYANDRGL